MPILSCLILSNSILSHPIQFYPVSSCSILFCPIPPHPVPTFVVFFELLEGYESVPRPVPLLHEVQVRLFLRQLSCNGESVWIADNCYGEDYTIQRREMRSIKWKYRVVQSVVDCAISCHVASPDITSGWKDTSYSAAISSVVTTPDLGGQAKGRREWR